jgi:hypothetical protein
LSKQCFLPNSFDFGTFHCSHQALSAEELYKLT